jgi:hypothetical protein
VSGGSTFDYYAGNGELVITIYSGKLDRREYDSSDNDSDNDGSGGDSNTQTMSVKEEEESEG